MKLTGVGGLAAGNRYPLVSYAGTLSGSFANLQLQMPYGWRGTLANVGKQIVLTNVAVITTTQTNIFWSMGSTNLTLSWPSDHTGWRLLMLTNNFTKGISFNINDWGAVTNSSQINQIVLPVNPSPAAEFYRLVYP